MGQTLKAHPSPKPKVPREEAIRRIREQIEIGRAIKNATMFSTVDLDNAQKRRTEWLENQTQILSTLFNESFLEEGNSAEISSDIDSAITFGLKEKYFKDHINEQINRLESFLERLKRDGEEDLMEEPMRRELPKAFQSKEAQTGAGPAVEKPSTEKPAILLIHGQDAAAKGSVLEFIEKLGLRALTKAANGGKGLIDKFREMSNAHFAIVLFTPADATVLLDKVTGTRVPMIYDIIFEFGYVVAKLGPERVYAICQERTKIPFDYAGAMFIPIDSRGDWRLLLAKGLKQAGIEIDLNKAI